MDCEMCLVYEKGKECRGAAGRKFWLVCIYCPNYERWLRRKKKENEERKDEKNN